MTATVMRFYSASIGKKVVMAVTGLFLFCFVLGHMAGNLQVYAGPLRLNAYAQFLQHSLGLLWTVRTIMFCIFCLHVYTALTLQLQNWQSRPIKYKTFKPIESSFFSRNMIWTGAFLACFLIYHILHLTLGKFHMSFNPEDVHHNVTFAFSEWPTASLYILSMLFLGMHIIHGVFSMFQSVGLAHPKYNCWRRIFSTGITLLVVAANISMPFSVLITQMMNK